MRNNNGAKAQRKTATEQQLTALKHQMRVNCYRAKAPLNPVSTYNSGDKWHQRKIGTTSLANSTGDAVLLAGKVMQALSGNAANVPVRIRAITAYAIAGTAGTYPPTFLQVNFENQEFVNVQNTTAGAKDSLVDSGGQGAGPPGVRLVVPQNIQQVRADWTLSASTLLATAVGLPAQANVIWQVDLDFKF